MIFLICSIFVMLFSSMKNLHSQHEYFHENLKMEREKLNEMKEKIFELKEAARENLFKSGSDCYQCWNSLLQLDYDSIYSSMELINQPIQRSYYQTLNPLQKLLIGLSFGNIYLMTSIYIKPVRLFLVSVFLCLIHLCIYGELFLGDTPSVYYTLTIGIWIFFFSIFLFFRIVMDLLMIVHYQNTKKIFQRK